VLALGIVAAVAVASGATAAPPRERADFYGMNIQASPGFSPARMDALSAELANSGAGTTRLQISWPNLQPVEGGVIDWHEQRWEERIASLAARGIRVLPTFFETAHWALDPECAEGQSLDDQTLCPPDRPAEAAAFLTAVMRRYGPRGTFWAANPALPYLPFRTVEIWNEPNQMWAWRPGPDPAAYRALFTAAHDAVKAVDPSIDVVVGGLNPGPMKADMDGVQFLRDARIDPSDIDGVAWHPYGRTPAEIGAEIAGLRAYMDSDRLADVPIYMTEWGWTNDTVAGGLDPTQRGALFAGVASEMSRSDCGIAQIHPHTWGGASTVPGEHDLATASATGDGFVLLPETLTYIAAVHAQIAGDVSKPRATVHYCDRPAPDRDGDGVADEHDYAPLDPASFQQPTAGPPTVHDAPAPYGTFEAGRTVHASFGTWDGAPLPAFSILRWEQCGLDGTNCQPIGGSASRALTLTESLGGRTVRAVARAANLHGIRTATSSLSPGIRARPLNTRAPVLNGKFEVGETITADRGGWRALPIITNTTYHFFHCSPIDWNACTSAAAESTSNKLRLTAIHRQRRIKVVVKVKNAMGTSVAEARSDQVVTF
jgi:hypothetical protein